MKRTGLVFFLLSLIVAVGTCTEVRSQTITATLEGLVVDPTGAAIPGATITAVNTGTRITNTVSLPCPSVNTK
jgi:hypothetical protein